MKQGDLGFLCTQSGGTFSASGICSNTANQLYSPLQRNQPYAEQRDYGDQSRGTAFLAVLSQPQRRDRIYLQQLPH